MSNDVIDDTGFGARLPWLIRKHNQGNQPALQLAGKFREQETFLLTAALRFR